MGGLKDERGFGERGLLKEESKEFVCQLRWIQA